ncbi:MAG: M23 family metallopeptidase [Pseudomonadota bacterium]
MWFRVGGLAVALVALSACDAVRYPGDGGEAPQTPASRDPDGPPGPPPPSEPVNPLPGDDLSGPIDADTPSDPDPQPVDPDPEPVEPDPMPPVDPVDPEPTPEPEPEPPEPVFSYYSPGVLIAGSGQGAMNQTVHAPDMVFPIRSAPSYLQSMVFRYGGSVIGGDECDARNYAYPWQDNFCETRTSNRNSPYCPADRIHQGQDIRVGTPEECRILRGTAPSERMLHEIVAVEDGIVYEIGTFTVKLRSGGRIYRYMHMNMDALHVEEGDSVLAGDVLGYYSKDFGGTPTTFHLHFEIIQNTAEYGWVHVPPYLSLVEAFERREGGPGEEVEQAVGIASTPIVIPEGMEIIE